MQREESLWREATSAYVSAEESFGERGEGRIILEQKGCNVWKSLTNKHFPERCDMAVQVTPPVCTLAYHMPCLTPAASPALTFAVIPILRLHILASCLLFRYYSGEVSVA